MHDDKVTATKVLTGSTGNPIQDAGIRGSYIAALNALATLACLGLGASDAVTVSVLTIVGFVSLASWGLFDKVYQRYLA